MRLNRLMKISLMNNKTAHNTVLPKAGLDNIY